MSALASWLHFPDFFHIKCICWFNFCTMPIKYLINVRNTQFYAVGFLIDVIFTDFFNQNILHFILMMDWCFIHLFMNLLYNDQCLCGSDVQMLFYFYSIFSDNFVMNFTTNSGFGSLQSVLITQLSLNQCISVHLPLSIAANVQIVGKLNECILIVSVEFTFIEIVMNTFFSWTNKISAACRIS